MSLGEFVRKHRKARRLTLQQVAGMAGTSKSYIWELENDRVPHPGFLHCIYIARAIGVSMEEMALAAVPDIKETT